MFQKLKDLPREILYGIKNLIIWFPIIWKDRNWDHYFIFLILRHKLHLTEQLIRNHGHHVNNIQDADKIKKCVLLLDRIIKDDYHENVFIHHDKKWGETELLFTDSTDYPDCSVLNITRENIKTKEDKQKEREEFRRLMKKPGLLKDQDIELLFKLMRKHILSWWD